MIDKANKPKDMAEQVLMGLQDAISIIRMMREPDTGSPVETFGCALDIVLTSGKHETWEVTIKRIESEVEDG